MRIIEPSMKRTARVCVGNEAFNAGYYPFDGYYAGRLGGAITALLECGILSEDEVREMRSIHEQQGREHRTKEEEQKN